MTNEEKNAIKSLKDFNYTMQGTLSVKEGKTILNLIEKQQKANEEKQDDINVLEAQKLSLEYQLDTLKEESILKKKIQDKIKYLDNQPRQNREDRELKKYTDSEIIFARDTLKELLESEGKI